MTTSKNLGMSISVADRHKHTLLLTSYSTTAAVLTSSFHFREKTKKSFSLGVHQKVSTLERPCYFIYTMLEREMLNVKERCGKNGWKHRINLIQDIEGVPGATYQ